MAQFYSLEEAARVLGISPDELKAKAQQREIRAFTGSGSWQFRAADVDEYARQMGQGSSPDLSLSDLDVLSKAPKFDSDSDADLLDLGSFRTDDADSPELSNPTLEHQVPRGRSASAMSEDSDDILLVGGPLSGEDDSPSSSRIIGLEGLHDDPADSDVRLVPEEFRQPSASDSDVKLSPSAPASIPPIPSKAKPFAPSDSGFDLLPIDSTVGLGSGLPLGGGGGDTAIRNSPAGASAGARKSAGKESDFEINPSSVNEMFEGLQPESGSDFELPAMDDISDEFEATPLRMPSDSDVTAGGLGASGVDLGRPRDSGINLLDFVPEPEERTPAVGVQLGKGGSKPAASQKNVFNDTDFEIDVLEEAPKSPKTQQLNTGGDFDDLSDGSSEIISLSEDDDVDSNAATSMREAMQEDADADSFSSDEDLLSSAGAGSPLSDSGWSSGSSGDMGATPAPAAAGPVVTRSAAPQAEWGTGWVVMLGLCGAICLFTTFLALDLVHNMYEFRGDSAASGLVKMISDLVASK